MPCDEDFKQAIAEFQRRMDATIDALVRRQNELFDRQDATLALVQARVHDAFAQLGTARRDAFVQLEAHVREAFTRLEAAMRMPPSPPDKEEPPRCH